MPNFHIYIYIYAVALRWPCACAACVNVCNAGLPKRTPNRNRSICRGEQAAAKVIESIEHQQISVREQVVAIIGSPSSTANGRARALVVVPIFCKYILSRLYLICRRRSVIRYDAAVQKCLYFAVEIVNWPSNMIFPNDGWLFQSLRHCSMTVEP